MILAGVPFCREMWYNSGISEEEHNRMSIRRVFFTTSSLALAAAIFAMFLPAVASAETYYWQGNEDSDPLNPSNYKTSGGTVLTALPPPGSAVQTQRDGMTIKFTDASAAFLASLAFAYPRTDSRVIIDVSTNITIGTKFYLWGTGYVVKRGAGTMTLAPESLTYDSSNRCYNYNEGFIVEGGDLIFPQNVASSGKSYHYRSLAISNGCTVAMFAGMSGSGYYIVRFEKGFCGDGRLICTNSSSECRIYPYSSAEPFSGELFATNATLYVNGTIKLTGTSNTVKSIYHQGGTLGARKFGGGAGASSLGSSDTLAINSSSADTRFLCLATEEDGEQSWYRTLRAWDPSSRLVFDGGAYGGLKLSYPYSSSTLQIQVYFGKSMSELVLTGSNTTECLFSAGVVPESGKDADRGFYYISKRGTGIWRMANNLRNDKIEKTAGIGVENGTLRFETVAERGSYCTLGYPKGPLLGYPYMGAISSAPPEVDYAIRLGNAANLDEEGTFEYVGTTTAFCKTRKIAVTGKGRLKNGSTLKLKWGGIKSVVLPEGGDNPSLSTLTLDGDSAPGYITDVTEEDGSAPLKIAKDGDSSWHLNGDLTFTGGIDVKKGLLTVANYRNWRLYRLVLKQNRGYGVTTGDWKTNYVYLAELGLFDRDGKRLNEGLARGLDVAKTNAFCLLQGQTIADCAEHSTSKFARLFDGDGVLDTILSMPRPISAEDSTSWKYVYMHLADSQSPVCSFDISYPNNIGGVYKDTELTHFAIEGSLDGETWHTLTNVTDFTFANSQKWSISGEDIALGGVVTGGAPIDTAVPAGELPTVLPNGISYLKVENGGSFVVYGEPVEVKGLGIDTAKGMGSVSNVTFAANGTINIEAVPAGQMADMPCDLSACGGLANVSRWPVKVGGETTTRWKASVTATGVKVFRTGAMVVIR